MGRPVGLRCVICGKTYDSDSRLFTCADCGPEGTLDVLYDVRTLSRTLTRESLERSKEYTIWRYLPLLPVDEETPVTPLTVGWTPLYAVERLGCKIGCPDLFIKETA